MIMPISAAQTSVQPKFKGVIKNSVMLDELAKDFTNADKSRWILVKALAENTNDSLLFQVYSKVQKIGKTIIKSMVINQESEGVIAEDVYHITKGGSVHLYDRQSAIRTLLETFERIYKK